MTDTSLYQTVGAVQFPLTAADGAGGLQGTDPARDALLEFFRAAINAEIGAAWTTAIVGTPLSGKATPVVDYYPDAPTADLVRERKTTFPALFVHRDLRNRENRLEQHTFSQRRLVQVWWLHYILPPLDVGQRRKFGSIFQLVLSAVDLAVHNLQHPAYLSGAYFLPSVGISQIDPGDFHDGEAQFADAGKDSPSYPALSISFKTRELSGWRDGVAAELKDIHITAGTGNADGMIEGLVEGDSAAPAPVPPP